MRNLSSQADDLIVYIDNQVRKGSSPDEIETGVIEKLSKIKEEAYSEMEQKICSLEECLDLQNKITALLRGRIEELKKSRI